MKPFTFPMNLTMRIAVAAAGLIGVFSSAFAALSGQQESAFQSNPVLNVSSATPLVMLNLSRDTLLFSRAYNDYSALIPGSSAVQTTYSDQVEYYGYFDSEKCYSYSSDIFTPTGTVSGYVSVGTPPTNHYCSTAWSGNFLNWATMTRMDAVRKILYGGLRYVDSDTATTSVVLERAYVPPDAHGWAKYYNGTDIASLTPFSPPTAPATGTGSSTASLSATTGCWGGGSNCKTLTVTSVSSGITSVAQPGDQLCLTTNTVTRCALVGQGQIPTDSATGTALTNFIIGRVKTISSGTITMEIPVISGIASTLSAPTCSSGSPCAWKITDLNTAGITLCNITYGGYGTSNSSQAVHTTPNTTSPNPPLVKIVPGDYRLWGANESYQCLWADTKSNMGNGGFAIAGSNGNLAYFSGVPSADENPPASIGLNAGNHYTGDSFNGEYVVRVTACPSSSIVNETCHTYPNGNVKPVGLLQSYGESGQIKFGLITGSYNKNISGGVVRANLPGPNVNGVNSLTAEINANTGTFLTPSTTGMIATLNNLKVYGYNYESGGGADNYGDGDGGCVYQLNGIVHSGAGSGFVNEGGCSNWGNPISQAFLESVRYFAGAGLAGGDTPTTNFTYTSSGSRDAALGLPLPAWTDPLSNNNYCASLNVLTFNGTVPSYEDTSSAYGTYYNSFSNLSLTETPNVSIGNPGTVAGWTDLVGAGEGISGSYRIGRVIGSSTTTTDGYCTAKPVTAGQLSSLSGICPDGPSIAGSYMLPGIAYAAHINRIRSDLTVPTNDTRSLKVNTYAVQLATNTPTITIPPVSGATTQAVTITPTYISAWGNGRIVDFRIVQPNDPTSCPTGTASGTTCGSYYVNYEDSTAGGDFDQDLWGIISYQMTSSQITVTTASVGASSGNGQGFGFTITGTTKDGIHAFSGAYNFTFADTTGIASPPSCTNCVTPAAPRSYTFDLASSTSAQTQTLQDPLWYAAKWGGFADDPNTPDGLPDTTRKWDQYDNTTGVPVTGGDGVPDNYYLVSNPTQLVASLTRAFSQIVAKVASGTAAAVVASAGQGSGAVYQAFYEPVHQETITPNRQARWIGSLQALFIGPDGKLYEDTNQDGQLTIGTDKAIVFTYDTTSNVTKFQVDDGSVPLTTPLQDLSLLKPIWNARKTLATPPAGTVVAQRGYSTGDTSKRYIFTWIDENGNGQVSSNEIYDFTASAIPSTDYFFFNLVNGSGAPTAAATEAQNIINWVRGQDLTGYRNRTLAYNASDGTSGAATQRLGDIIDSTPSIVATPSQAFDLLYGDQSYGVYRNNNACRRQVVLVGANDGMLHAFNAGFFNVKNQAFATSPNTTGCATGSSSSTNNYSLGEEIWAYVPQNLIPHLTWLTKDPPAANGYTHVYYVDGTPRIFDVNLPSVINHSCSGTVNSTTIDCSHWGTIAVVPFRLGGGLVTVDTKGDGSQMRNYHSGYIIMDVTDPEQPPKLIGEITLPGNQLATSSPTVVTIRKPDAGSSDPNSWYLVAGSGPDARTSVSSTGTAQIYAYDLNNLGSYDSSGVTTPAHAGFVTTSTTAFAGDLIASDWNLDFQSEGVYFGTQQTTAGADFNGGIFKLQTHTAGSGAPDATLGSWTMYPMYAASNLTNKPVSVRPTLGLDDNATPYVFFGTGRLFASADLGTTTQQSIFGLKDKSETQSHPTGCSGDAACVLDASSKLLSGCLVQANGTISGSCGSEAAGTTFSQLTADAANNCLGTTPPSPCYDGWQLNLATPAAGDTHSGSERVVSSQTLFGGELFTSTYIPNTSLCGAIGLSNLYAQNYQTGAGNPANAPFGTSTSGSTTTINLSTAIGSGGLASPPSLIVHPGAGTNGSATLQSCVQTSTGQIVCQNLGNAAGVSNGEVSWRQLLNNN